MLLNSFAWTIRLTLDSGRTVVLFSGMGLGECMSASGYLIRIWVITQ
jgi:hypothetical protein